MLRSLSRWFSRRLLTKEELDIRAIIDSDSDLSFLYSQTGVCAYIHECPPGSSACFHIRLHEIWISPECYRQGNRSLREVLLHEYIHAHDFLIGGIDLSTIRGLAISEIHAAMHCECRDAVFHKSCTRDVAVKAVALGSEGNGSAEKVVEEVFEKSYARFSEKRKEKFPVFFAFNSPYD
jgi:hypothetical protein